MLIRRLNLIGLALIALACRDAQPRTERSEAPLSVAESVRQRPVWHTVNGLRVLEITIGPRDAKLPAVVFLHGLGDHAHDQWIDGFEEPARYFFPQAPMPHGDGYSWFQFSVRQDIDKLAGDLEQRAEQLAEALEELTDERPTRGKPIVAGFSQGGMLSYALALLHPEQVAYAIPIAGLLPRPLYAKLPKSGVRYPPIFALHGTADDIVPMHHAADMTQTLASKGLPIQLQEFPGVRHHITAPMGAYLYDRLRAALKWGRS